MSGRIPLLIFFPVVACTKAQVTFFILELRLLMHEVYSFTLHRFEKNDILRIVRALAIFRPSLIAMQMPLTEEDEVFVEKSLQRSIIVRRSFSLLVTNPLIMASLALITYRS